MAQDNTVTNKEGNVSEGGALTSGGGFLGFLNPTTIGGFLGLGNALLSPLINNDDPLRRIREIEVDQALNQNLANRDRLLQQSPEAVRQMQAMALQKGRQGAIAQAGNIGAGTIASSGFGGGDVGSTNIAGIKAAAPILGVSAQYDQALANTYSQRQQQENAINQQLGANTMDRGKLAEMTAYLNDDTANPYKNWMSMVLGGANAGSQIESLISFYNMTPEQKAEILKAQNGGK